MPLPPEAHGIRPAPVIDRRPRCWNCGKLFAWFLARPWKLQCPRCRATCGSPDSASVDDAPDAPQEHP